MPRLPVNAPLPHHLQGGADWHRAAGLTMIAGISVVLLTRPPPMSLAPAATASSVQAETRSASPRKDQRADLGFGRDRITDPQCRHTSGEAVEKRALKIRMDIDPLHRHADLTGMVIATLRQRLDQPVEVGAPVNDRWRGATVLQRATRSRRKLGAKIPADTARSDKR